MGLWEAIRLRVVRDKEPIKLVARDLQISPQTVRKYVRSQDPPGKLTFHRERLLDRWRTTMLALLRATPKITAKRITSGNPRYRTPQHVARTRDLRGKNTPDTGR